ncbi:MAG: tryptophan--tRNA ligase [Candidatus Moraniibacteriota bacterium]|nr:MAG: tryptophan--tRNA ligase [Candidatus Moranbacteria bacterium]
MMETKRLFSGIQPTGNIHLGNYLGAVHQWVQLQDTCDAIFCVVDLHAITVAHDPDALRKNVMEMVRVYLAAGIDQQKSLMFVQSHVRAHTELCWILNCTAARMGDMEKMTQFKDKSHKGGAERASVGLFDYPVLMAADILLYDAVIVPVGEDQVQHVELARTLARRFNKKFGDVFTIPEVQLTTEGKRIMSLTDPEKKMSKSASSELSYIAMMDDAETVRKKIRKAVTDSGEEIVYRDDKPALKNLINIYALLSDMTTDEVERKFIGKRYGDFKNDLAEIVIEFLMPFQEKMQKIENNEVQKILENGAQKANEIAERKMLCVRKSIGLL